jgi:hypothetical protein
MRCVFSTAMCHKNAAWYCDPICVIHTEVNTCTLWMETCLKWQWQSGLVEYHYMQAWLYIYRVIRNDCRRFNNLSYTIHLRYEYVCFIVTVIQLRYEYVCFIRSTLQVLLHTLQVLCMCPLCDSTSINTIIEFVPNCCKYVILLYYKDN